MRVSSDSSSVETIPQQQNFSVSLKQQALALGFDKVGIVRAESLSEEARHLDEWLDLGYHADLSWMLRDSEKRTDPRRLFPSARSVIVVALNYFTPAKHQDSSASGKVSRYAWGDDYHDVVGAKLRSLLAWIREQDPDADGKVCVDIQPVMDKAWAVRAGLGWLGKHTNVITPELGSWVFIGELLVNLELDYDTGPIEDHCGTCTACLEACPTNALIEPYQIDATKCISYGTIELRDEELPESIAPHLESWVFGCDICQDVCPWTRFSRETREQRFAPRGDLLAPSLVELEQITDEEFSRRFRGSPIKRAKASGLRRNARSASGKYRMKKDNDGSTSD